MLLSCNGVTTNLSCRYFLLVIYYMDQFHPYLIKSSAKVQIQE